jgi:hypothetical protein
MIRQAGYVSASPIAELSPELARDWGLLAGPNERSMRRRIGWVWGLLFFNVMTYAVATTNLIPLPSHIGKLLPESAVGIALLFVLTANKRLLVRPNIYLILITAMCLCAALVSFRGYFGLGSMIRWFRFALFVGALWLTTPWWGRRDFMILHFQRRALMVVIGTVIVGMAFSPTRAFAAAGGGRLGGIIWPIQPTVVAHYSAMLVGMTVVLWLAGVSRSRWTGFVVAGAFGVLILTHSRIALVAMLAGILAGGLSLFLSRKRVRRALVVTILVVGIGALSFSPLITRWFARGENSQDLTSLTGRTNATYQDQGLVGDVLQGLVLIALLITALISPRGPGKAVALFLVVYLAVESFTQTGLGQPSADFLDLAVAMSLLMPPVLSARRSETSKLRERSA